ncbi:MAG: SRPBCC family protein [Pseudomonadota bacterium]
MSEYEHAVTVRAPADKVFEFVSNVENLPHYLPTVDSAEPQPGERVRVRGRVQGRSYDSDGYYRVNAAKRRMEWGSDGENQYRGWLTVEGDGATSNVRVHLSFEPRPDQIQQFERQTGDADRTIQQGLEEALQRIQMLFETAASRSQPGAQPSL